MASFAFEGAEPYAQMLQKLADSYDDTCEKMLAKAVGIVARKLRAASSRFARYIKEGKPRKNQYGWFAQVQFKGKTTNGEPAAKAANIYEYGREAGIYLTRKGNPKRYPAQAPRPFIRPTAKAAEPEVVAAMQQVYDAEAERIMG